jgi:aryl-alcohol dehydrogenase-like predicted oxidoreductase
MSSALILGGHSFIRQLGNDPEPDAEEAARIVAACCEHGITTFDTTYLSERLRLAGALRHCGRSAQAQIVVWNFFDQEHADGSLGGPAEWTGERLDQVRRECGRERIDHLVVHPLLDPTAQARQVALATSWLERGLVGSLGTWVPNAARLECPPAPYTFFVRPCNPAQRRHSTLFALGRSQRWQGWACSPFVRGHDLDRACSGSGQGRGELARDLLRYALFTPGVDRLIVSMRRSAWVAGNAEAAAAGPLTAARCAELEAILPSA